MMMVMTMVMIPGISVKGHTVSIYGYTCPLSYWPRSNCIQLQCREFIKCTMKQKQFWWSWMIDQSEHWNSSLAHPCLKLKVSVWRVDCIIWHILMGEKGNWFQSFWMAAFWDNFISAFQVYIVFNQTEIEALLSPGYIHCDNDNFQMFTSKNQLLELLEYIHRIYP